MLPKDFYNLVEKPDMLKHVLYSDTDSIHLVIPHKDVPLEEKIQVVNEVANGINNAIKKYLEEYLLPKSNINIEQNSISFKTELIMETIMFLNVKKNYAYRSLVKKGKIIKNPKVDYTGIQVVRSNAPNITRLLLQSLIEDIVFSSEFQNTKKKLEKASEIVSYYRQKFDTDTKELELKDIGSPGKWSNDDRVINGMILYNFIMGEEIFTFGSAGLFVYCLFRNNKLFQNTNLDLSKINGIVVPYVYDKKILSAKMKEYRIEIDKIRQWDTLYSTTCQRIIDLLKSGK